MSCRIPFAVFALVALAGGAAVAQSVAEDPAATSIDAKSLSAPMAAIQRDGIGPVELVLRLSNDKAEPMTVGLPVLVEASRRQGGVTVQVNPPTTGPGVACGAGVATKAPVVLAPGAQCQARLTLQADQPGEYKARIAVTDTAGTAALADATANVRAAVWWVILIALAGTAIGWFLKHWADVGRPRLVLLQRLYETTAAWKVADTKADELGLGAVTAGVGLRLAELNGPGGLSEKNDAELANLGARVRRLGSWIGLEIEGADVAADPAVSAAAQAVRTALQATVASTDDSAADTDIGQKLTALAQAIGAAQAGGRSVGRRRAAQVAPVRTYDAPEAVAAPSDVSFWRAWGDTVVGLLTAGLIAASAIELVWLPNLAWGGLGDMLKLFFGAVAAQAGALAVVDAFRGKFPQS